MHSVFVPSAVPRPKRPGNPLSGFQRLGALASRVLAHRLPRFLTVGCLGLASDALAFSALSALGAPDALARLVSLACATTLTWQLNRRFTFAASGRQAHAEAIRYAGVALCVQGLNLGIFLGLRWLVPALPALGALGASAIFAAGFSFAGQSLVTFRPRRSVAAPVSFEVRS